MRSYSSKQSVTSFDVTYCISGTKCRPTFYLSSEYNIVLHKTPKFFKIKADLEKVYAGSALKKFGICKWIGRFTEGRDTVKDDLKSSRPSTSVTDKIIADVQ